MQHTTLAIHQFSKQALALVAAAFVILAIGACACVSPAYAVTAAEKQAEAEEALANLTAMQETLDRLSAEYGEAVMAQEKAEAKCDEAEKRISEIKKELGELRGYLNERAREMYRAGNVPFLDLVLGATTFEEFATSVDLVAKVNQSNAEMIEREKALKREAEEQAALLEEQAELARQKSQEAEQAAAQAQATVAEMQATYDNLSAEAEQLLEEERKAREAEEAARAAAVLAEAQAAAEEEERLRNEANANEEADDDSSDDEADGDADAGDQDAGDSESYDEGASYEGGSDTVSRAYACLGAPYVWGGVGPDGYDCSGLVSYCLTGSHSRLGTTYTFMEWPTVSNPQPGDIAVNSGHTGVYIGDGQMIHAATYGVGVIIGPVQSGMKIVRYPG